MRLQGCGVSTIARRHPPHPVVVCKCPRLHAAYHPFDVEGNATDAQLQANIKNAKYNFDDLVWDRVSEEAQDLISRLLVVDPAHRMDTGALLRHPWIVRHCGHVRGTARKRTRTTPDPNGRRSPSAPYQRSRADEQDKE